MARQPKKKRKKMYRDRYRYVFLTLYAKTLDPENISQKLGIETALTEQGQTHKDEVTGRVHKPKYMTWILESRLRRNATLENHMKDIWNQVSHKKKTLLGILKKIKGTLTIALMPHEDLLNPEYLFPAELLNKFTSLGIDILLSFQEPYNWAEFFGEPLPYPKEKPRRKTGRKK